jgi:hypothetical protein
MDMNDMVDRCTDMMGGMMGNNAMMLVVLMALLLIWLVGLGAVGVLLLWGVRRLSGMRPDNGQRL